MQNDLGIPKLLAYLAALDQQHHQQHHQHHQQQQHHQGAVPSAGYHAGAES